MQHTYDDEGFFQAYAHMPRSRAGLAAAGEWGQLRPLFPQVAGKAVLDLGCGYGWHCQYAVQMGAAAVVGIDASEKMLSVARRQNPHPNIQYTVCGLEDYAYPPDTFDLVLSNLVLHYIADLDWIYGRVYSTLKQGGCFLFNMEHPVFTAGVNQDWVQNQAGQGPRETRFPGLPGGQATPYPHADIERPAGGWVCAPGGGGSYAACGVARRSRHGGRNAPPHDVAGQSGEALGAIPLEPQTMR